MHLKTAPALFLALGLSFLAFLPSLNNGFVHTWDDSTYLTNNPAVRDFSPSGIKRLFAAPHRGLYKPLVLLSFSAEYKLFGLNPKPYHLDNLLLHLANCALVFLLALRMTARPEAAFAVAALFGVHPMHVESVAWIAERKDMLYALFYLLAMSAYWRYLEAGGRRFLALTGVCFALSLLSKPQGISLPLTLLILDYFKGRRIAWELLREKLFFFAMAAAFVMFTLSTASSAKVVHLGEHFNELHAVQISFRSLLIYLFKVFVPWPLTAVYPYPELKDGLLPLSCRLAPFAAALVFGALFYAFRKNRAAVCGLAFFLATLLPVLPWLFMAPSPMFDHYSYLSYLGIFLPVSVWLLKAYDNAGRLAPAVSGLFFAVLLACAAATSRQALVWKDDVSLWTHAARHHPGYLRAAVGRAEGLRLGGDCLSSALEYSRIIESKPDVPQAYGGRALAFSCLGENEAARADCARAIQLNAAIAADYNCPTASQEEQKPAR